MAALIPINLTLFMYLQGVFETITGVLLLVNKTFRIGALFAIITLLGVTVSLFGTGQSEILLRDLGLLGGALGLLIWPE
jgi:predicted phage tail protein